MKLIQSFSIFFILSASNVFAGSVHDLKAGSIRYAGSLENLQGSVKFQLVDQAERKCGKGNVKRLFDINSKVIGDFEVHDSGESVFSDNYPRIFASAKVECE